MSVVCRILDGPVAPLAIHMAVVVDEPPRELLFMEVPGRDSPFRWVRLEPGFAALEDPDARFEWYDLESPEPYVEIDGNALYPYRHREGFETIVLPPRQRDDGEDLRTRLERLHAYVGEHNPLEGEPQKTMRVRCDRCGVTHQLNFDHFGVDWPDQLAGWGQGPEGDLCAECVAREAEGA